MNILEKMKLRARVLAEKKEKSFISSMRRKYRETHDPKYIHFLAGVTGEGDYIAGYDSGEPPVSYEKLTQ